MPMRILVLAFVFAVAGSACGDDDGGSGEEQAVIDALTAKVVADSEPGEPFTTESEARCLAEGLMDDFGMQRLAELGVTADSVVESDEFFGALSDAEISRAVDTAFGCADFGAVFASELTGLSDSSADCFVGQLEDSGFLKTAAVAGLRGEEFDPSTDQEALGQLLAAAEACFTPDEMSEFFGG